jgi:pyrroloquinoline quinone biosynthesis protein D
MPQPEESSQPRLATGVRWTGDGEERTLLFPEGALRLQGTGREIVERCDGQHTLLQIVQELQATFNGSDPEKIRSDVFIFIERLQQKGVVNF